MKEFKYISWGAAVCVGLVLSLILWIVPGAVFHTEGFSYPKATRDLAVIETWQEDEVYSFAEDLKCFSITFDKEFDKKHPEMSEFCGRLRSVWNNKYKEGKRNKVNLELFNSINKEFGE